MTDAPHPDAPMRLYDTLSGELRPLQTREPGVVHVYTCGPTVYNYTHVGHLRPALVADVLTRHLRAKGYRVQWISNFTDVDDKIITRAKEEGVMPHEVAQRYIDDYLLNMAALGVDGVERYARVTEHIPDIVKAIEGLMARGHAYAVDGDVYFAVESKPDYGKLAKRTLGEMQAGARVAVDLRKHHPMDFALWKASKPGEPSWPSPWGPGRPGWHIECSAMSLKYLGVDFDVHGGGGDLIFPHHENELAQSEALTGQPFVRFWLHNAMVEVDRQKMSKSKGNFLPLRDLVARYQPGALRLFVLSTHYRKPLQYSAAALQEAERAYRRLRTAQGSWARIIEAANAVTERGRNPEGGPDTLGAIALRLETAFTAALDDDLNTAGALGYIFDLVRAGNVAASHGGEGLSLALEVLERLGSRLGLWIGTGEAAGKPSASEDRFAAVVTMLVNLRTEARAHRDWPMADQIRLGLAEMGVLLEDGPDGTSWRWGEAVTPCVAAEIQR